MKDEADPVSPDEIVVRLIWSDYYRPKMSEIVRAGAFRPKKNEMDGISVFRAACLNDPRDALAVIDPAKRDKYAIALLSVSELAALGLTVQPARIDALPGHAVVPELNIATQADDSTKSEDLQKALAAIAARNVIPPTTTGQP
jgi:hypothetical protein